MSFQEFFTTLMSEFNTVLSQIINIFSLFIQNNFVKLTLYMITFGIVIWLLFEVVKLFFRIFKHKENKKVKLDIE